MKSSLSGLSETKKEFKIFEINEKYNIDVQKYVRELDELEQYVSSKLEEQGIGFQFLITGYDDLCDYIKDKDKNITVIVCKDDNGKIIAVSYTTQGQGFYTFYDLNKYLKFNNEYVEYAKSKYDPKELCSIEYETYMKKIKGYKYAKELINKELDIKDLVGHCKKEKEKGTFDERNQVREKVNKYIYDYFRDNDKDRIGLKELDRFYLLKFDNLKNCDNSEIKAKCENETEENKVLYNEYDELLDLFDLKDAILPDEKNFEYLKPANFKKYFDGNPLNTIEIDAYVVHPDFRRRGLARILAFEGLKIQIEKLLSKRPQLEEIFFSCTIHKDNLPSKKVIKSFGNFDKLYIRRVIGINREVYFSKIERKNLDEFLLNNEEKIKKLKDSLKNNYNIVLKKIQLK